MIAKPCCGSCERFASYKDRCPYSSLSDYKKHEEIEDCYTPRNPIKSKHENMWRDLKNTLALEYPTTKEINPVVNMVIDSINEIEENHE
jgi:hypothetical protein